MKKRIGYFVLFCAVLILQLSTSFISSDLIQQNQSEQSTAGTESPVVNLLYFYATDCPHCHIVSETVLEPLQNLYQDQLNIVYFEIGIPENYETLIHVEQTYQVSSGKRGIPTAVIGDEILIGEDEITTRLADLVAAGIQNGGIDFPEIEGFAFSGTTDSNINSAFLNPDELCDVDEPTCDISSPIYIAYFYQTGCKVCSRVEADLHYIQTKYPQIIIEEFNVYDQLSLGQWLAARANREQDFHTPAVFINDSMMIGETEITPQSLEDAIVTNAEIGAEPVWHNFNPDNMQDAENPLGNFSWLTIAFAGLIDGLNPCAFATIIFFVSYLSLSKRKGKDILLVGAAFTIGVFIAYLVVGLGFYKILDLFGNWLKVVSNWVYGLTALFCLVLSVLTFRDAIRVKNGKTEDMQLHLPEKLRNRINSRIRKGRSSGAYVSFAFGSGLIISMLELACTGQIYLPTIIFMTSQEALKFQAVLFLVLYNFMFIVPLVIVFILAYFGTTSNDLTIFLKKHALKIKIGMAILFLLLAAWLLYSIIK